MRKYAIPSASRIEALPGSRRFAFSRATVACAAIPLRRCLRPCWKRSYAFSLMLRHCLQVRKVVLHQVDRVGQVARRVDLLPEDSQTPVDRALECLRELER